jgi:protein-disulfide isomerase-like protein with CxxC motif
MAQAVDRITAGRRHLSRHSLEGVPALIQQQGDASRIIANSYLVDPAADLIEQCARSFVAQ